MAARDRSAEGRANRRRGRTRELSVRDFYRDAGWDAHRLTNSVVDVSAAKGYDVTEELGGCLIVLRRTRLLYIEVKSTPTPFGSFPPSQREEFLECCARAGADPRLFHWPKGVGIERSRIYKPEEWPGWEFGKIAA